MPEPRCHKCERPIVVRDGTRYWTGDWQELCRDCAWLDYKAGQQKEGDAQRWGTND